MAQSHLVVQMSSQVQYFPVACSKKKLKDIGTAPTISYPYGFFDGVVANTIGEVGIQLAISPHHCYSLKMGFGLSSNTRA